MANDFLKDVEKDDQRFFKVSKFWIENRETLKKVGYGLFIAFDAILSLAVIWAFVDGFIVSYPAESREVAEVVAYGQQDLHSYTLANKADPMDPGTVAIISAGEGKYDFYISLVNPNADWWAEFTYAFEWDGGSTDPASGFILPAEEKPIVAFSAESSSSPRGAVLTLTNVVWHRVDHHLTGEYTSWAADRLAFEISDPTLGTAELDGGIGRVSFTVKNASAYSYYEPRFIILLKRGSSVVGVNRATLTDLDSGEMQEVVVNWFGTVPSASLTEVIPEVNIFDVAAYKSLEGETTTDTRTRVFPGRRR